MPVIFFDFGGVLVEHIARGILAGLQGAGLIDTGRADAVYEILLDDALQAGRINGEELVRRIEVAADRGFGATRFRAVLTAALAKRKDSVWAIAEMLGRTQRLSIISDMPAEWLAIIRKEHDLSLFSDPVFSSEVGMTKQGNGIFRLALERHGVEPRQAVFIDDSEQNVLRARGCGMSAVLFTDPERLRTDLARLGLPAGGR